MWTCCIRCPHIYRKLLCSRRGYQCVTSVVPSVSPVLLIDSGTFRRQGLAAGIQVTEAATLKEPRPGSALLCWLVSAVPPTVCSCHAVLS